MKKKIAVIIISAALAASMSGCGADNTTAGAAGRLNTEAIALAELPEQEAAAAGSDHELTEEPEAEIEGSLIAGDEEATSTGNADQKPAASQTSVTGNTDSKNHSTSGNAATSTNTASNTGSSNASSSGNTGTTSSAGTTTTAATSGNSGTSGSTSTAEHTHQWTWYDLTAGKSKCTVCGLIHTHSWVEHNATGHYEEQVVTAAWDEPVYEYRLVCSGCGHQSLDDMEAGLHSLDCSYGLGWRSEKIQVDTIHHEAETAQVWVEEAAGYTDCSSCGYRLPGSTNHNH